MITYNPKSWITLIFAFHKSDTLRKLWKEMIYIGLFTLLIDFIIMRYITNTSYLDKLINVYSLIGFVISLLLVFRTNTAYDRWWEGRKKWGELVNDSRNLGVKLSVLLKEDDDKAFFKRMIPNFLIASKEHLRKGTLLFELDLQSEEMKMLNVKKHIPMQLVYMMQNRITQLNKAGKISNEDVIRLDNNLNKFLDSIGACERIKSTPIPYSYSLFIKKFIFIYVITLPLAFVSVFGYWSAFIATFIFYILVSMEILAEEIEDPFGKDDNDLPMDELAEKIKSNMEELFG